MTVTALILSIISLTLSIAAPLFVVWMERRIHQRVTQGVVNVMNQWAQHFTPQVEQVIDKKINERLNPSPKTETPS